MRQALVTTRLLDLLKSGEMSTGELARAVPRGAKTTRQYFLQSLEYQPNH